MTTHGSGLGGRRRPRSIGAGRVPADPVAADRPTRAPLAAETTRLRARSTTDLVLLLPYLLGYHPRESLVLAVVSGGGPDGSRRGQLGMCARVDLPWAADGEGSGGAVGSAARDGWATVRPELRIAELVRTVRDIAGRQQAEALLLVTFGADRVACNRLLDRLSSALEDDGVRVHEAIHTDGERWWSRSCEDECCPAEGTPYDIASSPLPAEAVLAGLQARPARVDLAASIAGPAAAEWPRLRRRMAELIESDRLVVPAERRLTGSERMDPTRGGGHGRPHGSSGGDLVRMLRQRMRTAVVAGLAALSSPATRGPLRRVGTDSEGPLTEHALLALALLATDVRVRDVAWTMITPADADDHVELWHRVVAVSPPDYSCAPLCLVGVASWIAGDGTLQMCCVERARVIDDSYSMASLLDEINQLQAPPGVWQRAAPGLRDRIGSPT